MPEKNITIYDISQEAGVSPATVSRVLTGNARVNNEKKRRILSIIEKYNYHPNALARGLINKASKTIGFIVPDITNPFFANVFLEAEKCAIRHGYTMILCNSMNDNRMNQTGMESLYLKMLCEKQVDGIIIMGGRANEKKSNKEQAKELCEITEKKPVVFINGKMRGVKSYHVMADEQRGIADLVKYLTGLGHSRIGFIGGRRGITSSDEKLKIFERLAKEMKLDFRNEWVIPGGFSIDDGYQSMQQLLTSETLPTAVMAVNDLTAIGAINAAKDNGLCVPEDLSVTGFDGIYLTDMIRPRITTVSQNYTELGAGAIEIILSLMENKSPKRLITVPTQLVIKDSCMVCKY